MTGTYSAVSDERLKKNIEPLDSTLSRIMQLQPRTYHFNEEQDDDPRHIGLIAQELKQYFPEVVSIQDGDEGGAIENLHTVAYSELVPVLIKAVQEQQAIIDRLETRIDAMEASGGQAKRD